MLAKTGARALPGRTLFGYLNGPIVYLAIYEPLQLAAPFAKIESFM